MTDLHWSIDSLAIRDNVVFGFGWAFHPAKEVASIRLRLYSPEAEMVGLLHADPSKPRGDVERAFPGHSQARNPGFVIFGSAKSGTRVASVELELAFADGLTLVNPVPASCVVFLSTQTGSQHRAVFAQLKTLAKRGLHLLSSGQYASLFSKVRRYLNGRPKSVLQKTGDLAELLSPRERRDVRVILDHDLGGGANHYRARLTDSVVRDGATVVVVTFHVATLSHMLIVHNARIHRRYSIPSPSFAVEAMAGLVVNEIIYNTGVSFTRPEEIPQILISLKQKTAARLKVLVHDFFVVCPSHFLLDSNGRSCRIPELNDCAECLRENRQGFATLFAAADIKTWRSVWGSLLAAADEIVAFSNNSADLLQKAYPGSARDRLTVIPHHVKHLPSREIRISNVASLCIGVVGQIGLPKGSLVVQALAREIKRRRIDVKIVVVGTIEANCDSDLVTQTGAYQHDDLPRFIEESGANIMLFPSVWPETFSYVVQELMDLNLPVASFDLGAPAERLSAYAKGLVLGSMEPANILDELTSFHRKIYLAQ